MLSATASLGLVLLWDVDGGLTPIDKYLYSAEDYIKVSFYVYSRVLIVWGGMSWNYAVKCIIFRWCFITQLFDKTV
jgi:hypothetical protein